MNKLAIGAMAAAAFAALAGCGKKADGAKDASAEYAKCKEAATTACCAADAAKDAKPADPKEVLLAVNGEKLTRGEIEADVAKIIEKQGGRIPADQLEAAKEHFRNQIAQQFVMKTLLLGEAKKLGVKVTDEERKKRTDEILKNVAGRPNAPKTVEDLVKEHPMGAERGKAELEESFTINKLLDGEVVSKVKVDAKKVDEAFAKMKKSYDEAVQKAAGAETKIKDLAKQLEGLKGKDLEKKFAELAKANSECPSKDKGGDLGEFTRGQMVKEFDEVAFSSEPFKVSAPVKTQFGWHLVMVTKKIAEAKDKDGKVTSPEKVQASHILVMARAPQSAPSREQVEKNMKGQQEQTAMREYFEKLRNAATIEAPGFPRLAPQKPAPKAEPKKPEVKSVESKPVAAPAPKAEAKPAAKVEAKPAPKAEAKPAPKAETKPAPKAEAKPAPKAEAKPAAQPAKK